MNIHSVTYKLIAQATIARKKYKMVRFGEQRDQCLTIRPKNLTCAKRALFSHWSRKLHISRFGDKEPGATKTCTKYNF